MKYCSSCGSALDDRASVCPHCGKRCGLGDFVQKAGEAFRKFNDTDDSSALYSPWDVSHGRGMAVLSYLGLLFLVPLFVEKHSPYVRFHVNQGIVLFLFSTVSNVLAVTLRVLVWLLIIPRAVYVVLSAPLLLISLLFALMALIGIVNALLGRAKDLPLIGRIRILK